MPEERRRRSASGGKRKGKRQQSSSGSPARSRSPPAKRRSSREERSDRKPAAAAKESRGARAGEEKPAKRSEKAAPPRRAAAAAASEDESEEDAEEEEAGSGADGSLEERVAMLEVENAALKAENSELKKKLIEFLRKGATAPKGKASVSRAKAAKPGQAPAPPTPEPSPEPKRRKAAGEGSGGGGGPVDRRLERLAAASSEGGGGPVDRRQERLAAAAADPPSERAAVRRREEQIMAGREARAPSPHDNGGGDEDPMRQNAVMLANGVMEVYNEAIPNNIPNEKRLPMVKGKLDRFMASFGEKVQIVDLKSGGSVIKDRKTFIMRYGCVFRESGAKLKGTCHKRFYFDASGNKPTLSLDFETHESLVTATPGTPQDGKLGVRDPRTEHLAVLYEERGGKVVRMFLRPDTEKLGADPTVGETVMTRTDLYKAFEAKIVELMGGSAGPFIFHNYHETPTVG